jgi:dephospho-CoA kinase
MRFWQENGTNRTDTPYKKERTPMPILYILRGAPGTGKTALAAALHEALHCPWFEFGWIPEFRYLNPHTEITYEEECALSTENLILVVKNYFAHGFASVIVSDLEDERIPAFARAFDGNADVRILTLDCDDETRTNRILTRDNGNGYRDTDAAAEIAERIRTVPYDGELRLDSQTMTPDVLCNLVLLPQNR